MCHQPPGTDICNTFKSSLTRGYFGGGRGGHHHHLRRRRRPSCCWATNSCCPSSASSRPRPCSPLPPAVRSGPALPLTYSGRLSVLRLLPLKAVLTFATTCRVFRALASSHALWVVLCRRDWGARTAAVPEDLHRCLG